MEKLIRLKFNDPAPDAEILTAKGTTIHLSKLWAHQTLLLVFTRHFGCPQCKEMLDQLMQAKGDLQKVGLTLAVVTQGEPAAARAFCEVRAPGVMCLCDPGRQVYRAYGLAKGSLRQVVLSPQVVKGTLAAKKHGHNPELPPEGQDVSQMSGTFIIGIDGRVRLPYYYDTIADHPPIDLLLSGVLSTNWDKPFDAPLA